MQSSFLAVFAAVLVSSSFSVARARAQQAGDYRPIRFGDPPQVYDVPLFEGADLDPEVLDPAEILGRPVGSWVASPEQISHIFARWSAESPRARSFEYARTYEGRPLHYTLIAAPEVLARLDEVRRDLALLSDPRTLNESAQGVLARTPAVAWMGYSIHGDETSGSDAALAVAHYLIAGRAPRVQELLKNVLIVMDPCMNPDGRARFPRSTAIGR